MPKAGDGIPIGGDHESGAAITSIERTEVRAEISKTIKITNRQFTALFLKSIFTDIFRCPIFYKRLFKDSLF
jgi:hypothetical protein